MAKNVYINEKRPHESAVKHVSGYADYTDDIKEPVETLFGAIGWSKQAHAKLICQKYGKAKELYQLLIIVILKEEMMLDQFLMVIQYFHLIKLNIMDNPYLL